MGAQRGFATVHISRPPEYSSFDAYSSMSFRENANMNNARADKSVDISEDNFTIPLQ